MLRSSLLLFVVVLAACTNTASNGGPPITKLYFPTGIAHVDVPGKTDGVLYVANANFDKRYATGSINAIALDKLLLPALGSPAGAVKELPELAMTETQSVQIASFSGELAILKVNEGHRIYVPTRSEGMRVYQALGTVDADGVPTLTCLGGGAGQNCTDYGPSLSPPQFEQSTTGIPRAPSPYGVGVAQRACTVASDCCVAGDTACTRTCSANKCLDSAGEPFADVYFTHLTQADSPLLSLTNFRGYLVRLDSDTFTVDESNFINIGPGSANSVAVVGPWAYVSGRILNPQPNLMRIVRPDGVALSTALESVFRVSDARSVTPSSDGKRLYVVGRVPDTLMILNINDGLSASPSLSFVKAIPLCDAPNQAAVIPRAGRGDLVAVTCTSGGNVALYDDDVGDLVALVSGIGVQPFGLAVDTRGDAARIYTSLFGDGRIAVIDIPDLSRPQDAHLVAHLGAQQLCLTRGVSSPGCIASQTSSGAAQ